MSNNVEAVIASFRRSLESLCVLIAECEKRHDDNKLSLRLVTIETHSHTFQVVDHIEPLNSQHTCAMESCQRMNRYDNLEIDHLAGTSLDWAQWWFPIQQSEKKAKLYVSV